MEANFPLFQHFFCHAFNLHWISFPWVGSESFGWCSYHSLCTAQQKLYLRKWNSETALQTSSNFDNVLQTEWFSTTLFRLHCTQKLLKWTPTVIHTWLLIRMGLSLLLSADLINHRVLQLPLTFKCPLILPSVLQSPLIYQTGSMTNWVLWSTNVSYTLSWYFNLVLWIGHLNWSFDFDLDLILTALKLALLFHTNFGPGTWNYLLPLEGRRY